MPFSKCDFSGGYHSVCYAQSRRRVGIMERLQYIFPEDILEKYEIYNYYHAAEILSTAYGEM